MWYHIEYNLSKFDIFIKILILPGYYNPFPIEYALYLKKAVSVSRNTVPFKKLISKLYRLFVCLYLLWYDQPPLYEKSADAKPKQESLTRT